jgi:hypothetical protein
MVTSLKKLQKHNKEQSPWGKVVVLRSHPYITDRVRVAEAEIGALALPEQ